MSMPGTDTCRSLSSIPRNSVLCVPVQVNRIATLLPSAKKSLISKCTSGKTLKKIEKNCFTSSCPCASPSGTMAGS